MNTSPAAHPAIHVSGRKLSVLLIQPPNIGGVQSFLSHMGKDGESIGFKPPIGLLSIATVLKTQSPHQVTIIDAQAQKLDFDDCLQAITRIQPHLIGISTWTDWWFPAHHLGRLIKSRFPQIHLCFGGPHVSIFPEETLACPQVDSIIAGDGEEPFRQLCETLAGNRPAAPIPGLHLKATGVQEGRQRYFQHTDLDSLPIPDRTLLPLDLYSSVLSSSHRLTTMITTRGCPFRCNFCHLPFQKTVSHSSARILAEFQEIANLGIEEVEVYDDTFSISRSRVREVCEGLIRRGNPVKWAIRERVGGAGPEVLNQLKRAGCYRIHFGIESGVDRVLQEMGKNCTTRQAQQAVRAAKAAGLTVLTYFMFGNLGETADDIKKTIAFALKLRSDYAQFSITVPYPGTELYKSALTANIIPHDFWREYARAPTPGFVPSRLIENLISRDELMRLRNEAIRRFYFRPGYILKELRHISGFGEIVRKALMGLRLLQSLWRKS